MSKMEEDPLNPKISVVCGFLSGCFTAVAIVNPDIPSKVIAIMGAVILGGFSYLAYRLRKGW